MIEPKDRKILSPEAAQAELVEIFRAFPNREAATARMARTPEGYDIFTNSVIELKLAQLVRLIEGARITPSSKHVIRMAFATNFSFGYDPAVYDIFRIIGVEGEHPASVGIFSTDPRERMRIEREIYQMRHQGLIALADDPASGQIMQDIVAENMLLATMRFQFQRLYGAPISAEPAPTG